MNIAADPAVTADAPEYARDAGLAKTIGTFGLTASIVNSVVGAGIFVVPASMAMAAGAHAYLAFLACALAMGMVVLCFAEGGRRVPTSGGPYGYIDAAFGPLAGSVAGTLLWASDVLACGSLLAALAAGLASVVPAAWAPVTRVAVTLGTLGALVAINVRGASSGARFVALATLVKILPLLLFIVVGAAAMHPANFTTTNPESTQGFGRAVILAMFTLTGMETALGASGEVSHPARTIPRALISAMLFVSVLYVAIQLIAQGVLGAALSSSATPLADAMGRVNPVLRVVLLSGATISTLAWIGSDILGSPRFLFAMARDRLLPAVLGRIHPRTRAPYVAILAYAAIAATLALSGTFAELAVLATLTSAALYLAGCAAVWKLTRRDAGAASGLARRWLPIAAMSGIASMTLVIVLGTWTEIAALFCAIALGAVAYGVRAWRRGATERLPSP